MIQGHPQLVKVSWRSIQLGTAPIQSRHRSFPLVQKCCVSPSWEVDDPLRLGSLDHSKDLNIQPLNIFLVSPSPNLGSTGYPKWGYHIKKIPPLPEQIGPCQEAPETSHPFFLYFMEHAQWHAVTCAASQGSSGVVHTAWRWVGLFCLFHPAVYDFTLSKLP